MIEIVKSAEKVKDVVRNVLVDSVDAIEEGLQVLDLDLKLDEDLSVEFLAKDSNGEPVVIMLEEAESGGSLIQDLLLILQRLQKNRFFLERIYKEHLFDFSVPPRVFVLAPGMSEEFVQCLESIKSTEIIPCEYSFLQLEERTYFTVARKGGARKDGDEEFKAIRVDESSDESSEESPNASAKDGSPAADKEKKDEKKESKKKQPPAAEKVKDEPKSPPPAEKPKKESKKPKEADDDSPEAFFQVAREKIKRITPKISESRDGNLVRFKIDDKILSSLAVQNNVCYVFLGEKKDKAIKITSEKVLNETLNQIYKLYITQFGPAKTA